MTGASHSCFDSPTMNCDLVLGAEQVLLQVPSEPFLTEVVLLSHKQKRSQQSSPSDSLSH